MQQCEEGDLVDSWLWQDIPSFIIIFSPAEKFANWGLYFLGEGTNNVLSIYDWRETEGLGIMMAKSFNVNVYKFVSGHHYYQVEL